MFFKTILFHNDNFKNLSKTILDQMDLCVANNLQDLNESRLRRLIIKKTDNADTELSHESTH